MFNETWEDKMKKFESFGKNKNTPTKPVFEELHDLRFHNWRFFKGTFSNKCNTCCKECEHYEDCQCRCDFYEETWILGKEFICDNCTLETK